MVRTTLIELFIFLLPFMLFFLWRFMRGVDLEFRTAPLARLTLTGGGLVIVLFFIALLLSPREASHSGEVYVMPTLVDGEVVRGHYEPMDGGSAVEEAPADEDEPEAEPEDDGAGPG
jgi:hypothetical protein